MLKREDIVVGGEYVNNQGKMRIVLAIHGDKLWTKWEDVDGDLITVDMSLALNNWSKAPNIETRYVHLYRHKTIGKWVSFIYYTQSKAERGRDMLMRDGYDVSEIKTIEWEVPE